MQSSYKKLPLGFILQMFLFRENSENQIEKTDDLLQKVKLIIMWCASHVRNVILLLGEIIIILLSAANLTM